MPTDAQQKPAARRFLSYVLYAVISGCVLFGEIMPFGVALYGASYIFAPPYAIGFLALLATLIPHFMPMATIKYALAMILFTLIVRRHGNTCTKTPIRRGALMGGCVFVMGLFMLFGGQILLYDCFILVLEGGITTAAVCLFAHAKKILAGHTLKDNVAGTVSLAALMGVSVLGISNLLSITGLSFTVPLCVLATLMLSHQTGPAAGAAAGITLGFFAMLESGEPLLGAFAAAGMAAGYFSRYGKAGAAVSFITANAVITFYTGGTAELILNLYEVLAPTLIYLIIPQPFLARLDAFGQETRSQNIKLQHALSESLGEKARAFSFLSETFQTLSDDTLLSPSDAAAAFFEKATRQACTGCRMLPLCWKKEFHRTYAAFFVLLEICCKEGHVQTQDIPASLEEKCLRKTQIIQSFNTMYEVYKTDKLWESRMKECRLLVSRQLGAVSHILQGMEKSIRLSRVFSSVTEELLLSRFAEKQLAVRDVHITEKETEILSVTIRTDGTVDPKEAAELVSDALSSHMEVTAMRSGCIRLASAQNLRLDIGGNGIARDQSRQSGDSFDSLYMENGHYLLAISDGMGSGTRAGRDSRATIDMLKALFSAGFDADTAITLVNSVLVLQSAQESFSTIDMVLVNAKKAEAEFIKIGAAASFLKHGGNVRPISSDTLPAGILGNPEATRMKVRLSSGDMIVMITDGIADADRENGDMTWISDAIRDYNGTSPREFSEKLLQLAKSKSHKAQDDMTVLTAIVKENSPTFVA